ncbi:hypothetical protein CI109_103225 [Kwoniella shandongensis]|uniref:Uncharacterized protein n=1 Tax=Kwoniella shandongensis TaxID=1734106 RepID=A0A5M6CCL5_9TREE|nr:uncharacterized protein CI109_000415 [Kwoniella shandongensis]KAA5531572.1 hypothetical protein CI109_000415 [Kwoniella shandongensis]
MHPDTLHPRRFASSAPRLDTLYPRDTCVSCDSSTPTCNCAKGEKCILTSRTCNQCAAIQCIKGSSSSSSSSVNPGVIAGPVVAVLVIASLVLFWWLRKKKRRDLARLEELAQRARKAESAGFQLSRSGSPAPGSAQSRHSSIRAPPPSATRPRSPLPHAPVNAEYYDENGATIRVYNQNVGTIHVGNDQKGDPFSDRQSISTMGSGGTANIIPIQWIPPSKSDEALSKQLPPGGAGGQSAAARLNEARQNLFKPNAGAPQRPARSPDLDLRLNPPGQQKHGADSELRSPTMSTDRYRDSFLSGNSAAPSYWSGQSDVNQDAPKIVTSKQVQVGRLQQAEMIQFGGNGGQGQHIMEVIGKAGGVGQSSQDQLHPAERGLEPPSAVSPTSASYASDLHLAASGGEASGSGLGARTLTPIRTQRGYGGSGFDDDEEEGLRAAEPVSAGAQGDLRFSMGSLAYRDSVSTMGTGRYLASAISVGSPQPGQGYAQQYPQQSRQSVASGPARGSVGSSKSFADSVLGAFPMIPPGSSDQHPPLPPLTNMEEYLSSPQAPQSPFIAQRPGQGLPQSTSTVTLDHHVSRPPPPSYRPPPPSGSDNEVVTRTKARPETQASVADSLLGSFPFVSPNEDDMAELPSATLPREVRGMSEYSENGRK